MIPRILAKTILTLFKPGFIAVIYGPRRVGKTVLLHQLVSRLTPAKVGWFNGDTLETRQALGNTSQVVLSQLVKNYDTIIIDEAQRIENISLSLKILIDAFPQKHFIISGSSSLRLTKGFKETLTGRTLTYKLYPLSTTEITAGLPNHHKPGLLEDQLRFGGYPYLTQLSHPAEKIHYLKSLIEDYLFRDVLLLKDISSPQTLTKLTTLLAFQIGSEVSLNELAINLSIDVKTVKRYLFLLQQSFIIFELSAFSKNLRKEVAKSKKYYFWDLGIRNALTDQFLPLDTRTDTGQLWENFLAVERLKVHEHQGSRLDYQYFFWRTYDQAEIDWIEINEGQLSAYEFKFKPTRITTPKLFMQKYGQRVQLISRQNYLEFVS